MNGFTKTLPVVSHEHSSCNDLLDRSVQPGSDPNPKPLKSLSNMLTAPIKLLVITSMCSRVFTYKVWVTIHNFL